MARWPEGAAAVRGRREEVAAAFRVLYQTQRTAFRVVAGGFGPRRS